jgi:integrase
MVKHEMMGGRLHVYRRPNSPFWQCSTCIDGHNRRVSTKQESLGRAKDFAEDWYLELKGKHKRGEVMAGKPFKLAAARFLDEFEVITQGERNQVYVAGHRRRVRLHLLPFFGDKAVTEITPGLVQDYRIHRMKTSDTPPARSTLHQEIVCLRQILKAAERHGWLASIPNISPPYRSSPKISHRAWFSPAEYKSFYEATRERARNPLNPRWRTASENLHDYVLFMVNTGLRPDEALRLEYRDVAVVTDGDSGERLLEIEVRGKHGVGFCKSMPGAVLPFKRLKDRNDGQPTDRLFPSFQRELFNTILDELNLKVDRDGQRRTAYSLRHTYICMRLMEGADIYQIAKNCRTSVEMIENYYASHIKNTLNAASINVRRPKAAKPRGMRTADERRLTERRPLAGVR